MKLLVSASVVASAVVAASTFVASDARAGLQFTPYGYCGTGGCSGSYLGFRNGPNPNDYADFIVTAPNESPEFFASYAGNYYSCYAPSTNPQLVSMFQVAISTPGSFNIQWNSSGQCTFLQVDQVSYYSQTW